LITAEIAEKAAETAKVEPCKAFLCVLRGPFLRDLSGQKLLVPMTVQL
jgi:hypothetical protein